jgi:hypothetical protein
MVKRKVLSMSLNVSSFATVDRQGFGPGRAVVARVLWLLAVLALPLAGSAAQFVLFDVTFTYTKEDAENSKPSKSHYYVKGPLINPQRPVDWTAPVDYRNGTAHIRLEVLEKPPGSEPTTWSVCYIPNKGQGNGYGCFNTDVYKEKGVYEKDVPMKSFWQNDAIIWSQGIKQMDLVIKDNSGGGGHAHKRADHEKFFPTKVRMTVIQVSAGAKYDPSLVPGLPKPKVPEKKDSKEMAPKQKAAVNGSEAVVLTAAQGCCGGAPAGVK